MNNFVDLVREHSGNEFVNMSQPGFHHQPPHPPKKRKTKQRLKETCLKVVIPKETTMFIPVKSCLLAQPLKWKSYSTQPFPLFLPTFLPHPFVEKLNTLRVFKTSPQVHHFEKKKTAQYHHTTLQGTSTYPTWRDETEKIMNSKIPHGMGYGLVPRVPTFPGFPKVFSRFQKNRGIREP